MRMTHAEFRKTCEVYKKLAKQKRLALEALDGSDYKDYIYLHICAQVEYLKWCLNTRSYTCERPWLVKTNYYR